jgi:hypothetical protein
MSRIWFSLPVLLTVVVSLPAGQQPKSQPKPETKPAAAVTASGVFTGRSGKPMARARLVLGAVAEDGQWEYAWIKLVQNVAAAIADEKGRFQFKGVTPGRYTVVYQPTGAPMILPTQISIRALSAEDKSILPMMKGVEAGKYEPLAERPWGQTFTLLKGHTFWSMGANMKIWNATVRWRQGGAYMEMRKGVIWQERFDDKNEIKLDAWSY